MALYLGTEVVCGEISNLIPNRVAGWLALRGCRRPLILQLTGDCAPDLAGRHVMFEAATPARPRRRALKRSLAAHQIGPTGTITASLQGVRSGAGPDAGTAPAAGSGIRGRGLYLEWSSQNGRIVVHLPTARFQIDDAADDLRPEGLGPAAAGIDLCGAELVAAGGAVAERGAPTARPLDARSKQLARLMDEMLRGHRDVPLARVLNPPLRLRDADQLDDVRLDRAFKRALARLARHHVALDMCRHFSARQAYRLLRDTLIFEKTYPDLPAIGFVQHFLTHEYCPNCKAEWEHGFSGRRN